MHFQQVCLTALAFSAAHGGTLDHCPAHARHVVIHPLEGSTDIVVEQDLLDFDSWQVRLSRRRNRLLHVPVRFPPVRTQAELLDALTDAWRVMAAPPAPFLTRFLEPPFLTRFLEPPASIAEHRLPARTPARHADSPPGGE